MKKFQVKLVSEKFMTISAESEERLLQKLESMQTSELRIIAGQPEWSVDTVSDMAAELEPELVLVDDRFYVEN